MKKAILNLLVLIPISMFAIGNAEISGKVTDIHTGSPLFECHVYLTENYGVLTDTDGFFRLEVPAGYENELLHISYVGYETYFKPLVEINEDFLVVRLIEDLPRLEEVIVYADPWNEFKEVVLDLSLNYETKDEFYADLFKELKKIELEVKGNNANRDNKKAVMVSGGRSVLIIILTILLASAFMIWPLIDRFNNINNK